MLKKNFICQDADTHQATYRGPRDPAWATQQQDPANLHGQRLESAALIQTLAEQNTQLVQRAESLRVRVRVKVLGVVVILLVLGVGWLAMVR